MSKRNEALNKEGSYFQYRMDLIGFNPETDVAIIDFHPDEPHGGKSDHPLFWEGQDGSIHMGIMDLDGELVTYDKKGDTGSRIQIEPIFYKRKKPGMSGPKFLPGVTGMGVYAYLTQLVIDAVKSKQKLETLYITEGQIKAFVAGKNGLPCIGLPGITVWKPKTEKEIFYFIRVVMDLCKPRKVVYITDSDTFDVKFEFDKDLGLRPNNFYTSLKLYKKFFQDFKCELIWKTIQHSDLGKGIDDILISANKGEKKEIKKELEATTGQEKYFYTENISIMTYKGLKECFSIQNPTAFYNRYQGEIGLHEFIFFRSKHKFDDLEGKVVTLKSAEAAQLVMIGNVMYKKGGKPTKTGSIENVLVPIKDNQLLKMCGSRARKDQVFHEIDYFDGAINLPSHTNFEPFQETYDENNNQMRWFNMYRPVTWMPEPGDFSYSMKMIKHIFGEEEISHLGRTFKSYELGLDYIKLLWEKPQHMLPILTLYSQERETGKTTFWNWMRMIFQQNVRTVRPEHLTGQFTSYFANSLLVIIDESLIEKNATMERVKGLVTADKFTMEAKFSNAEEVESFIKVGMGTNNKHFAKIDSQEIRFWVRPVSQIKEKIFDLDEKLEKEINAFLHYLENRKFVTHRECRAWFAPSLIETNELSEMKMDSRWKVEKELETNLQTIFSMSMQPVLHYSSVDLRNLLDNKYSCSDLRKILKERLNKQASVKSQRYVLYYLHKDGTLDQDDNKNGLPYDFLISEVYKVEEYSQILDDAGLIKLEKIHLDRMDQSFYKDLSWDMVKRTDLLIKTKKYDKDRVKEIFKESKTYEKFSETFFNEFIFAPKPEPTPEPVQGTIMEQVNN